MNQWQTMRLGDVCVAKSGNSKIIKGTLPTENDGSLFPTYSATGQDVFSDGFDFEGEGIVISAVGARCGKCFLAEGKWRAIANTHVILPKPDKTNARFLWYLLNDESFWIKGGTAQPFVKIGESLKTQIAVPPLTEQERIVKLLDEADALRKLRAQADRRTATLIPALFHEMFGDPATNSLNLPTKELRSLCRVLGGGTPSKKQPEYWSGKFPWVSPKDMSGDDVHDSEDHISEQAIGESATNLIPAGSILVVTRSGILKHTLPVAINSVPVAINQDIKAFVPMDGCDSTFIAAQLRVLAPSILGAVRVGATVQNLETDALKRLSILCPRLAKQKEFGQRVTEIRALEAAQAKSRERLDALFQSLLHRAFNGEL